MDYVISEFNSSSLSLLGYLHEQSRTDRDKYVEIKWDNIPEKWKYAFKICKDCDLQDLPYDIGSIMQYHAWSFAIDTKKPTIVPKNGASLYALGQRNGFSESDVTGINKIFCQDTCYVDKYPTEKCLGWKWHCGKKEWGDWMKKNCARTCEVCRKEIVTTCEDGHGAEGCKGFADRQLCKDETYGHWMAKNCAKTCKICE